MNEQEAAIFGARMGLAEFRRQYRESRRSIEWRVTFAVWALMVGIATTLKSYAIGWVVFPALVVTVFHYFWVRDNFEKAERDATIMWADYKAARAIAKFDEQNKQQAPQAPTRMLEHFPAYAAVAVTAALGILAIAFTQLAPPPTGQVVTSAPAPKKP